MRRLGLSSALVFAVAAPLLAQQQVGAVSCRGGKCERVISGAAPAATRLRVNANGPVSIEGGVGKTITYTVRLTVQMRTEAEARHALQAFDVRMQQQGPWAVMTTPGGAVTTTVTMQAPKLAAAVIATTEGPVVAAG